MNKLYQASKVNRNGSMPNIPDSVKKHPDFKKNTKMYYGLEQSDTQSEYNRNMNKFYGNEQ
jgi:hypothetical protein